MDEKLFDAKLETIYERIEANYRLIHLAIEGVKEDVSAVNSRLDNIFTCIKWAIPVLLTVVTIIILL